MTNYVLDTNIVSIVLRKKNSKLISSFNEQLDQNDILLWCPVVYYEVKRGLLRQDAKNMTRAFELLFRQFQWEEVNRSDWEKAAELWAARLALGRPIADNDLF